MKALFRVLKPLNRHIRVIPGNFAYLRLKPPWVFLLLLILDHIPVFPSTHVEVVEHEEEADDEENDDADHDHPPPSQPIALPKKKTWKKKAKDGASDGGGPQGKAGATSKGKENVTKGTKGVGKGNGVGGSGKGKNAALGGVGGGKAAAKPRASPLKRKQEEVDEEDEY
eukprot:TRINITY_DN1192_c0_g1_i3.p1 TRINITY_DN1192_c0_g1~~TRINITY_DN1192_c0_g1_i3.p1  ORF type:complete len:169 (+),score=45.03 TRINITY_DN1192_c0_g1_i3:84-590(+)